MKQSAGTGGRVVGIRAAARAAALAADAAGGGGREDDEESSRSRKLFGVGPDGT